MKVLILEDEIPAYQKLVSHLEAYFNGNIMHDWSRTIAASHDFLTANDYDFIISDIQLLDGLSFDLFDSVSIACPIIFCSAHDEYLFKAFNANGIAYILKPYTEEDFKKAIEKYQALFTKGNYKSLDSSTLTLLKSALQEEQKTYKKRLVIKKPKGIELVKISDVSLIEASGDFCIVTDYLGKRHTISQNMGALQAQLNPQKFYRINRSQMIHIEWVEQIESYFKNRLLITMKGKKEAVMTSTSTTAAFRKWLEL